jgi:predicted Zn finger-like uncharacterized protein
MAFLSCVSCQTVFEIDAGLLGDGGQQVRCSVCQHVWLARPEDMQNSLPEENRPVRPGRGRLLASLLILGFVFIGGFLFWARGPVSAALPVLLPAYDLAGIPVQPDIDSLAVEKLQASWQGNLLRLHGELVNKGKWINHAAPVRIIIHDKSGKKIEDVKVLPEAAVLAAGEASVFFAQITIVPDSEAEIVAAPIAERIDRLR